jgi:hypothetical protein
MRLEINFERKIGLDFSPGHTLSGYFLNRCGERYGTLYNHATMLDVGLYRMTHFIDNIR